MAASLAEQGIATLAINLPGHGFGPLSTLTINRTEGPVTFVAGGRGTDRNGDNLISSNEGGRSVVEQSVADFMQLVRVLQVGMDVDGDGVRDVDPARIYYVGTSLGSNTGVPFVAVEPDVRAAVFGGTGGFSLEDTGRFRPEQREIIGSTLANRVPSLLNGPGVSRIDGVSVDPLRFHENLPLRNGTPLAVELADGSSQIIQSPVVNTVAGAMAIQQWIENGQWMGMTTYTPAYAPYLRRAPLPGVPAKAVIFQVARGDLSAANPGTTAVLRAGDLADRTLYYRHDLAHADNPALPRDPHLFMTSIAPLNFRPIARGAQQQIAAFFASDGAEVIHPEPRRYFEVPIQGPLPEELNYIV